MSILPIPHAVYENISEISPQTLANKGIKFVLADLDNTLAGYKSPTPSPQAIAWNEKLQAEGITLFILSNSRKPGRVDAYAQALAVPFQAWSGKPKKKGFKKALDFLQAKPEETVMVGDQIFTDILGARRMHIKALLVQPIHYSNFGQVLRHHILEFPFRYLGRKNEF